VFVTGSAELGDGREDVVREGVQLHLPHTQRTELRKRRIHISQQPVQAC
jgi:hypothetical protein